MTDQSPERLSSARPDFTLGAWRLYGVMRGQPTEENHGWGERAPDGSRVRVYRAAPGEAPATTTANWKGYTEVYHLGPDGRLTLVRFDYASSQLASKLVNEVLEGDFFLVLKASFRGPRLYVRFLDGTLVPDRAQWLHERHVANSFAKQLFTGAHPDYPDEPKPPDD